MKKFSTVFLSLFAAAYGAYAQVVAGTSFFNEIISDWHMGFTADTAFSAAIPSDLTDASGSVGVYDAAGVIKFQGIRADKDYLSTDIGYKYSYYDFSDIDPNFSSTNKAFGRIFYQRDIDGQWGVFGLASGTFAAAFNGDMASGGTFFGGVGASYTFSKSLRAGLGVGAYSRLDRDWLPLPIAYVEWTINRHWSLRTFSGAALICDVWGDGELLLNFSAEYDNSYIRLREISTPTGQRDTSLRDSYVQVAVGATWHATKKLYFSATVGSNVWRSLDFRVGGDGAFETHVDAAPVFFFHTGYLF